MRQTLQRRGVVGVRERERVVWRQEIRRVSEMPSGSVSGDQTASGCAGALSGS